MNSWDKWIADLTATMLAAKRMQDEQSTRRNHSPAFRVKVALAAVTGEKTLAELAQQFHIHPTLSTSDGRSC
jgi:transposase-like protein